jgi:hypothetical protein
MSSPLDNQNPLPECLFMKLHCEPITLSTKARLSAPVVLGKKKERASLKLTLRFGKHENKFRDEIVAFGLCGGRLRIKVTNARILMESIQLPDFLASAPIEKQEETSQETEGGLEFKLAGGIVGKTKDVTKSVKKYQNKLAKVYSQGKEEELVWEFELDPNSKESFLRGMLQEEIIGIIQIDKKPCKIKAFFEFQDKDILTMGKEIIAEEVKLRNIPFPEGIATLAWIKSELQKSQLPSNIMSKIEVTI